MDASAIGGSYDVAVVGGGHNGLVSAALFAKAGLERSCSRLASAREAAPTPRAVAGASRLEVNTYSYVAGLMPRPRPRRSTSSATDCASCPFGPYFSHARRAGLELHEDAARRHDSIAQFSSTTPTRIDRLRGVARRHRRRALAPFLQVPPRIGSLRPGDLRECRRRLEGARPRRPRRRRPDAPLHAQRQRRSWTTGSSPTSSRRRSR